VAKAEKNTSYSKGEEYNLSILRRIKYKYIIQGKIYYLDLKPFLLRVTAIILFILSLVTVISEITIFSEKKYSLFGYLVQSSNSLFMINIFCVVPLTYLFLCALKGLFSLKLSSYYGIYNNQNTDSFSLLFLTR
jgi:hypothetical protein